jgi:hypothetical protein
MKPIIAFYSSFEGNFDLLKSSLTQTKDFPLMQPEFDE